MTSMMIPRWFGPPELLHPDLRRRARVLWIVSWPFLAVVALVLGVAVLVEPQTLARRATTIAAVAATVLVMHAISRAGRPVLASWILVIGLSVIVTQRAWITGGIHAPVAAFYALFIVMGGVLIGVRGGIATASVCLLGAIILTIATDREWLTVPPGAGSAVAGLIFVVLAIGLALVVQAMVAFRTQREKLDAEVVQMLVHDMRSPIQVMLGHLQMLREETEGENLKDVDAALGGAKTLSHMTTGLLDISRLEAGRMPVNRSVTDLATLARSVVDSLRVLQPTRVIAVETDGDASCSCDRELTRRTIENLVSNAMKHTPLEGEVRVVISGSRDRVRIAIHDEGPGVSCERRARIFEPYSAEGLLSLSGYASTGIGLAFCRLAVEAQGGTIRMEDGVPRGSVFIVELPR